MGNITGRRNLVVALIVILSAVPGLAADFKMPGFKTSWAALDPSIQDKILLIIMIGVVVLIVAAIASGLFGGAAALFGQARGDVAGRSGGIGQILLTVGVIFCVFLAIGAIIWLAG